MFFIEMNHENFEQFIFLPKADDENFFGKFHSLSRSIGMAKKEKKLPHENKVKFLLTSLPYDKRHLDQPIYLKICFLRNITFNDTREPAFSISFFAVSILSMLSQKPGISNE